METNKKRGPATNWDGDHQPYKDDIWHAPTLIKAEAHFPLIINNSSI